MKLFCAKDGLQHAVQTVQKAIATKTTLPILTGIYFSAKDGMLELQATDYEIGISCTIEATVEIPGTTVLSGRYFQELVRKLPGDIIEIAANNEEKTIRITSGSAQFNLLTLPAEEFPVLKPMQLSNIFSVKDVVLKELIKKTVFACATDESRPIFTGALLEADEQSIRMVGTNTHRLALKIDKAENPAGKIKMIIPAKILAELARLLTSDLPYDVNISWQKNQVSFSFDNIYITSRLIEGQFPDYNKVIPANFNTRVIIDADEFLDAVERVSLLARDGEYNVIKFYFRDNSIIITSNNPDIGKACETVPAELSGAELEIAFNSKYITDILKNINSEKMVFSLINPLSPASIKPLGEENYTYIITPVRTS